MQTGIVFFPGSAAEKTLGLWVYSAALGTFTHTHAVTNRYREDYQLLLVRDGQGSLQQYGNKQRLVAGDSAIVYPQDRHSYSCNPATGWHVTWVHFAGDWAAPAVSFAGFSPAAPVIHLPQAAKVAAAIAALIDKRLQAQPSRLLSVQLLHILALIGTQTLGSTGTDEQAVPPRFRPVLAHIQQRFASVITVQTLAELAGYSEFHFARRFRQLFKTTPMEYVCAYRLQQSQILLVETQLPIHAVAERCGYQANYFAKIFRQRFACTPVAFRRQHCSSGFVGTACKPAAAGSTFR